MTFVGWPTGQHGMSVHEMEWVRTYLPVIYYHKVQRLFIECYMKRLAIY